jgi:hypothetical protein
MNPMTPTLVTVPAQTPNPFFIQKKSFISPFSSNISTSYVHNAQVSLFSFFFFA